MMVFSRGVLRFTPIRSPRKLSILSRKCIFIRDLRKLVPPLPQNLDSSGNACGTQSRILAWSAPLPPGESLVNAKLTLLASAVSPAFGASALLGRAD
mgnify:CR=1 FL=1